MITNLARAWGARIIEPIAKILARMGLTPNMVTISGFALTLAVAIVLATGRLQLAGVLLIITLGADGLDGTLARLTGRSSRFGAFLDSTLDRWAEVAIYGALVWYFMSSGQDNGVLLATAAMASSLMVSYTRARAEGIGIPLKEGLLTRLERLIILIVGLIFPTLLIWALWTIAVLAGLTAIQRIYLTWRMSQDQQ
jgi:CDP-diacylglycerol--glycerol-3-phosphate 3-phosphatidyltransferase